MEKILFDYISKYGEISEDLKKALIESDFIKLYKKGQVLLKEGELSNECFFILKGCIRSFCIRDAKEKTVEIYTEKQSVSLSCYGKNEKSTLSLVCVEDTIACVGTPKLESEMFEKFPQLVHLSQQINSELISNYKDAFAEYKLASPEQRYLNLSCHRPDLLQRVPQHQIASYLGMSPESLSRIRKRISIKNT